MNATKHLARMRPLAAALLVALLAVGAGAEDSAATGEAETPEFEAGVHYRELAVPVETRDPSKIEVVEVFSYACIHCYNLEPVLAQWLRTVPDDVDFHHMPLVTQRLEPLAQAFYTAEALNVLDRIHLPMFAAIHEYNMDMRQASYAQRLFVREADVDEDEFLKVYESFGVRSKVRQADALGRLYRIMATPTLVVNGRYVTEAGRTGMEGMFVVVNHLIEQERARMAAVAE